MPSEVRVSTFVLAGIDALPAEVIVSPGRVTIHPAAAPGRRPVRRRATGSRAPQGTSPNRHLAPAELKKDAGAFDLPIAAALLVSTGQLPAGRLGEFAPGGQSEGVRGQAGLPQPSQAKRSRVPVGTIRTLKRSRWDPTSITLVKFAPGLGASPGDFEPPGCPRVAAQTQDGGRRPRTRGRQRTLSARYPR
jgi:magnesium chelatase family protein